MNVCICSLQGETRNISGKLNVGALSDIYVCSRLTFVQEDGKQEYGEKGPGLGKETNP